MSQLHFENRVAIVTAAGSGLGKEYAKWFASRRVKVVVHDIRTQSTSEGHNNKSSKPLAEEVVDEIKAAGGIAIASTVPLEQGDKIVQVALDAFGGVDILINNFEIPPISHDSFSKMTDAEWNLAINIHLKGVYKITKAAWKIMRQQEYGRIINTSSLESLHGSFGSANYATANMGVHGLTQALAREGEKKNIHVNTVIPVDIAAITTQKEFPKEVLEILDPKHIVPLVAYLSHDSCKESGSIFEITAGYIGKLRWQRSAGHMFDLDFTEKELIEQWGSICDFQKNQEYPRHINDTLIKVNENIERISLKNANNNVKQKNYPQTIGQSLESDKIFRMIGVFLERGEGQKLVDSLQTIYGFNIKITEDGPVEKSYTIDLKNGMGKVTSSQAKLADSVITITDDDFQMFFRGKLQPHNAIMTGKIKITGNKSKAAKFSPQFFPILNPENIAKYTSSKL